MELRTEEKADTGLLSHLLEDEFQLLFKEALLPDEGTTGLQAIAYFPENTLCHGHAAGIGFHPVGHKGVDKAIGGGAAEAIAFLDEKRIGALSGGRNGGRDTGKSAAEDDQIIGFHRQIPSPSSITMQLTMPLLAVQASSARIPSARKGV